MGPAWNLSGTRTTFRSKICTLSSADPPKTSSHCTILESKTRSSPPIIWTMQVADPTQCLRWLSSKSTGRTQTIQSLAPCNSLILQEVRDNLRRETSHQRSPLISTRVCWHCVKLSQLWRSDAKASKAMSRIATRSWRVCFVSPSVEIASHWWWLVWTHVTPKWTKIYQLWAMHQKRLSFQTNRWRMKTQRLSRFLISKDKWRFWRRNLPMPMRRSAFWAPSPDRTLPWSTKTWVG